MRVRIDLAAYRRNLDTIRRRLSPSDLMAVVKDDAYGHGRDDIVATALDSGITRFAVLDPETGVSVRASGVPDDVMLLAWLFHPNQDFVPAVTHRVDLGVSNVDVLNAIGVAAQTAGSVARVHLKIDSGLHRNGAHPSDWPDLVRRAIDLSRESRVEVAGIWTHIGEASDEEDDRSQRVFEQARRVAHELGIVSAESHLAASAAGFARPEFRYDFARVGGFTYGVAPGSGLGPADLGLEPVMSAHANVIAMEEHDGQRYAILDAGYLDGIPAWTLPSDDGDNGPLPRSGFDVLWNASRYPITDVGPDSLRIDVSLAPELPSHGDEVILFGSHLRGEPVLQEWADATGTVGEEIVVRVGQRAERDFIS